MNISHAITTLRSAGTFVDGLHAGIAEVVLHGNSPMYPLATMELSDHGTASPCPHVGPTFKKAESQDRTPWPLLFLITMTIYFTALHSVARCDASLQRLKQK
jgi:hypothetical protein